METQPGESCRAMKSVFGRVLGGFWNAFRSCQLGGTNFVNDGPYKPKLTKIVIKHNFIALVLGFALGPPAFCVTPLVEFSSSISDFRLCIFQFLFLALSHWKSDLHFATHNGRLMTGN